MVAHRISLACAAAGMVRGFSPRVDVLDRSYLRYVERLSRVPLSEDPMHDEYDEHVAEHDELFTLSNEKMTMSGDGTSFADTRVGDVALDYGFPVSYIADALIGFGVPPPIRDNDKLGDLVNGEQAFALLEALTSLDGNDVQVMYVDFTLEHAAYLLDVDVADLFSECNAKGFALPHGLETQLRRDQLNQIAADVRDGTFAARVNRRKQQVPDDDEEELESGKFHFPPDVL